MSAALNGSMVSIVQFRVLYQLETPREPLNNP